MKHETTHRSLLAAVLPGLTGLTALAALALGACATSPGEGTPDARGVDGPGAPPRRGLVSAPWTRDFLSPAVLVADEIRIEGPTGLRDHMAVRQDNVNTSYTAKTTRQGLLQETEAKPDRGYVEIHGQLDALQMVAFRRIVWLEKPGDGPVVVRAYGDASWERADGTDAKQGPEIELVGSVPR